MHNVASIKAEYRSDIELSKYTSSGNVSNKVMLGCWIQFIVLHMQNVEYIAGIYLRFLNTVIDDIFGSFTWIIVAIFRFYIGLLSHFKWISESLQWRHNMVWWRLKSPALRLFAQPFIRAQIKENIKALRHWPLCGELTGDRWIPRTNGQ